MAVLADKYNYKTSNNQNVIYLIRNEQPKRETNKKKGRKSEVYAYELKDVKRILNYFRDNKKWIHYLLLTFGCNMARRIGDTLALKWLNIYDPSTGRIRTDILEITEDKTDKLANPKINKAVQDAIELYIANTDCNPADNNYANNVFLQLSDTHKGATLSDSGHLKALKRAAKELGIDYDIGTHSARKFFGKMNRMLHPGDYDSMEILQTIYNQSDTKTTKHYIGLTKQKVDKYYDDMGEFYNSYVVGDREYVRLTDKPIVSLDANDLRDIIKAAYQAGRDNCGSADAMEHIDAITSIMGMAGQLAK